MKIILQKIGRQLQHILEKRVPKPELCRIVATPPEPSELWIQAKDFLTFYPPGTQGRETIVGVFVHHIQGNPALIARLHPATSIFHLELVREIIRHPKLTDDLRSEMHKNPEITAALL